MFDDPAVPIHWGAAQKGMQADNEVDRPDLAKRVWLEARDAMIEDHERMESLGLHKQVANRILEPWMNITVIISGTEWANFFALRTHKDAEPNFQALAKEMWDQYTNHMPLYLEPGVWHRPLADDLGMQDVDTANKIAVGRCARVSYLTHDGVRDFKEDVALHDRLLTSAPLHASPAEHVAKAIGDGQMHANFRGWKQYRSYLKNEAGPDTRKKCTQCGMWSGHVKNCPITARPSKFCPCLECKHLRNSK